MCAKHVAPHLHALFQTYSQTFLFGEGSLNWGHALPSIFLSCRWRCCILHMPIEVRPESNIVACSARTSCTMLHLDKNNVSFSLRFACGWDMVCATAMAPGQIAYLLVGKEIMASMSMCCHVHWPAPFHTSENGNTSNIHKGSGSSPEFIPPAPQAARSAHCFTVSTFEPET